MDVQKYSLVNSLREKNQTLKGSPSTRGMSAMTIPKYINAMRTTMFTSQLKQFLNLTNAETPFVFTSMEKVAGKYSSGHKEAKSDLSVYRKIAKFEESLESPQIYYMFVFDKEKQKFDVLKRNPVEDLTENFGFEYDNTGIDSFDEGDEIPKGTPLFHSKSYDDDLLYGYGLNVTMMYTLDPYTAEDAAIVSESLAKRMTSIESEVITIGLNQNDYLLNLYGDSDEYLVLPPIGTVLNSGYINAVRRQYNAQLLYDFTDKSLREIHMTDEIKKVDVGTQILDYEIYSSLEEEVETDFNRQLLAIHREQNKFYKEIYETCCEIMDSGYKYSRDIEYLKKRSGEFLDKKKKWKEGDAAFTNMVIEIRVKKVRGLALGQKVAGRYGNKSVVSEIRPDIDMPITEDGRRVHIMFSLLGIINRTTSFPLYEMFMNAASYKLRRHMIGLSDDERVEILFQYLSIWNKDYAIKMRKIYDRYDEDGKTEFIENAIVDGIYIHMNDVDEDRPIFYKCIEMLERYGSTWLKSDKVYLHNRSTGRDELLLTNSWVGEQYIIKLKQTDRRGASIRSTGAIDITSLPTRNNKSKQHLERTSSNAIRFGEFESLNFSIGLIPSDIVLFHALYRTSTEARKDLAKMMFVDEDMRAMKLPTSYTSNVAVIFGVILKSLGLKISYINDSNIIRDITQDTVSSYQVGDTEYVCTEYQAKVMQMAADIEEEIINDNPVMEKKYLAEMVTKKLRDDGYLLDNETVYDENYSLTPENIQI